MKPFIIFLLLFKGLLVAEEKELQIFFILENFMGLEDGSIWEVGQKETKLENFVSITDKVSPYSDYQRLFKERCFFNRYVDEMVLVENTTSKNKLAMKLSGFLEFRPRTVSKIIPEEKLIQSSKLFSLFMEFDGNELYATSYVPVTGDSLPFMNLEKTDTLFVAKRSAHDFFFLNLTKGDLVSLFFLGELNSIKSLDEVKSLKDNQIELSSLGTLEIFSTGGDSLSSWSIGDEVIARSFKAVGPSLYPSGDPTKPCVFLHNTSRNKAILAK